MAWGRAVIGGSAPNGTAGDKDGKANGAAGEGKEGEGGRRVNVLATASVDQTVKVSAWVHIFRFSWIALDKGMYG